MNGDDDAGKRVGNKQIEPARGSRSDGTFGSTGLELGLQLGGERKPHVGGRRHLEHVAVEQHGFERGRLECQHFEHHRDEWRNVSDQ